MRFLVPLLTAAALAIAGWLATGIVTVRSLDAPARIGLLAPLGVLLTFLLPLLALSGLGLADAGRWRPVWRAVLLLVPVALPWLPLPLPPALLIWTGPLAVLWWTASIAYVYADASGTTLAALGQRALPRVLSSPTRAPLVAAAISGAALVATAWHTAPQHPTGDEPDYLVITQSLWLDHDLAIENNHERADYAAYHPTVLPPSYLARGTDGAIYSVHAPGLPALLVPGFAAAGYRGAVATLVLFAMAGAWLAWRVSWDLTGDARASWVGTLATVGAAPFLLHGAAIFPDAPAAVLALSVVGVLFREAAQVTDVAAGLVRQSALNTSASRPYLCAALALGILPWLHTRYAILAVGLGAACVLRLASRRDWRALAVFTAPAAILAAVWFGFFLVIYGTPSPSAPYGAYTQMALAHLWPGLPGLLFDQQFGLLASAPALVVAIVSLRSAVRQSAPHVWRVALLVIVLGLSYTCVVAAYRMWWGGFSAPARFLVPLVLPLAPLVAVGWQSLRTRASRHLAVVLLTASLALTAIMVVVDHGALAYNTRDGRARWASWASPLVDLVAALPAAHRDAPVVVVRDTAIWITALSGAWALWRVLERRGRLTPLASLMSVAVLVPAATATTWATHGVTGLAPGASQVRYLEVGASSPDHALIAITPPPVGRTRTWFEVELDSRRSRGASDYMLLRLDHVPAGRYRLFTDIETPGARLGVTLGDGRTSRFLADLDAASGPASAAFDLALPVADLVVKGSREAAGSTGRTWIVADAVWPRRAVPAATRTVAMGDGVWLLPEDGIYPEAEGAWLAGDADVTLGVPTSTPLQVSLRAGAASVEVWWSGARDSRVRLAAGETRVVTMVPEQGRLRLRARGGFRPSRETPGTDDRRYLSVWISAR